MRSVSSVFVVVVFASIAFLLADGSIPRSWKKSRHPYRFDYPAEADRFFYGQRVYPFHHAPDGWRERAMRHLSLQKANVSAEESPDWKWIGMGPENIAGRIRAMAMDPRDPKTLYAGAAGGGVWKTTDGGITWRALDDFLPNLRIGSIATHPVNSNVLLAGNGEGFVWWQGQLAYGRGIYRSDDAGETWRIAPGTDNPDFEFVFDIVFDPFEPQTVLASSRAGIMRSEDGGETWQPVISGARGMMASFSKTTSGLVYAALEGQGIRRSTDHGATWSVILRNGISAGSFSRVYIAPAPSNGDIVYAAFTALNETCAGVYRTSNRGDTWRQVATPINEIDGSTYMGWQGSYNSVLTVHPTNPSIVWAGGIDLYRTTDAGTEWKQMTNWYPNFLYTYVHADQHALIFNPENPSELYAACDGGVFRSVNGGASFIDANSGLVTTQFHSGTPHPANDVVLGGTIDNGTLKVNSGSDWSMVEGGDGGATAIDYHEPRVMYTEIYWLWFHKSTNFGQRGSWQVKMEGIPRSPNGWTSDRSAFMAPVEMDPMNPKILYAGTYRLFRTTNGAELWTPISGNLSGSATAVLTAIAVSKSNNSVIYTGSSIGMVSVSTNSGGTWRQADNGLPARYVTDLATHFRDPATAYVTLSGFGTGHVYRTTDYGATWTDASGTGIQALPDVPANTIAFHPANPQRLYVGTDAGMFHTSDGGLTWRLHNDGMGNVTVADLQFRRDGMLFAATHGRGMFRSSFSLLDTQRVAGSESYHLEQNYPNPFSALTNNGTTILYTLEQPAFTSIEVYDFSGRRARLKRLGHQQPGRYHYYFDGSALATGVYFYRLHVGESVSRTMKMMLVK